VEDGVDVVDVAESDWFWTDILAVAMDKRERTRSKGYVVQTEVMPANAPLINRVGVSSCLDPLRVKSFFSCS